MEQALSLPAQGQCILHWLGRSPLRPFATCAGVIMVIGALALLLLIAMSAWTERSLNAVILLCVVTGIALYLYQGFVKTSAQNLQAIGALDSKATSPWAATSGVTYLVQLAFGLSGAVGLHLYFVYGAGSVPPVFSFLSISLSTTLLVLILFLLNFTFRFWTVLLSSARRVTINLLQLDAYYLYANPLIQVIGVLTVFFCLILLAPELLGAVYKPLFEPLLLLFALAAGLVVMFWVWPLAALHNRIQIAKTKELHLIDLAICGDANAMSDSAISSDGSLSTLDLVRYQAHIRSLWTWPVHAHVQRLVIFGVLPPLAWITSALIEVALQAQFFSG